MTSERTRTVVGFPLSNRHPNAHLDAHVWKETIGMTQYKDFFATWTPRLQSVLRIVLAGLFFEHGTAKLLAAW
jgi:hypothetical protein